MDEIKLTSSDLENVNGSDFVGYVCKVSNISEVRRAYKKLWALHPAADHIVTAYCLKNSNKGYQDDYEMGAGHRMLKQLEEKQIPNIAAFSVRFYGGRHLGPRRFEAMAKAVDQAVSCLK